MSFTKFAKSAFSSEKPHSSITDWVEILTGAQYQEEAYDGIPELVDSINLQAASGPAEACRAIRKKLKHGNPHQQYRALVLLKALVENCGQKFQSTLQDGQLVDALKGLAHDSSTDKRVKKKLVLVLGAWHEQYKDDPYMGFSAGLYKQVKPHGTPHAELAQMMGLNISDVDQRKMQEKDAKRAAKERKRAEREEREREEAERKRNKHANVKRVPFEYEKDKPKVLQTIVEGSQASSNLVNAITLVNRQTDSLQTNERVQETLDKAKKVRKSVVRYIQLVENEEVIGTLIETNDRLMAALEMYERLSAAGADAEDPDPESTAHAKALTSKQIAAPAGEVLPSPFADSLSDSSLHSPTSPGGAGPSSHLHPDLEDLSFGGAPGNLPAPIRPKRRSQDGDEEGEDELRRGSLSDFSDYESSDEETHNARAGKAASGSGGKKAYVTVSDDEDDEDEPLAGGSGGPRGAVGVAGPAPKTNGKSLIDDDPFADPFADR